jgi:hypothetical protein
MYPPSDESRAKPDTTKNQKRRREVFVIPKVQKRKKNYKYPGIEIQLSSRPHSFRRSQAFWYRSSSVMLLVWPPQLGAVRIEAQLS